MEMFQPTSLTTKMIAMTTTTLNTLALLASQLRDATESSTWIATVMHHRDRHTTLITI